MSTTLVLVRKQDRRDKRGRRIGYNWWREYNVDIWRNAHDAWSARRESDTPAYGAAGAAHSDLACYQLSDREYRELFPRPTFKECLLDNRGMNSEPEVSEECVA